MATVGSILSATPAEWVNEPPYLLSGAVASTSDISGGTIYLGASASSTPGSYVGAYFVFATYSDGTPFYSNQITAYDHTTKRATAASLPALDIPAWPLVGTEWWIIKDYPLQRQFQWNRNGVPIPNAVNTMYTLQSADIGATITVTETSGSISSTNQGYNTYEVPSATTTTTSAGISVTGTISGNLVMQDNISYLGSFRLPASIPAGIQDIRAMNIMPAAYAQNGQQSLVFNTQANSPSFSEVSIPALSTSSTFSALNAATVTRTLPDAFAGKWSNSGIINGGAGLTDPLGYYLDIGSGKSILGSTGFYTRNVFGALYRRNTSTASTGTVDGPFSVCDPTNGQLISRCHAGSATPVPASWRSAMGGDLILGTGVVAIVGAASDGPAAIVINSSDITAAVSKSESGTARGGSLNTIQLSASCVGNTTDYYKNWWIYVPSCTATAEEPKGQACRILSFDSASKIATLDPSGSQALFNLAPTASTAYSLYPVIAGRQLVRYNDGQLDPVSYVVNEYAKIWDGGTFCNGMFWPNGTDSLVVVGRGGGNIYQYGIGGLPNQQAYRFPARRNFNGQYIVGNGPGPMSSWHCDGTGIRFWTYSAQDLQSVIAGAKTYSNIKPNACWSIRMPTYNSFIGLDYQGISGVAYDQTTRRLYICSSIFGATWAPGSPPGFIGHAVHVYEVTNAVAVR